MEPVFTVEAAAAQRGVVLEEMVRSLGIACHSSDLFSSGDPLAGLEHEASDLIKLSGASLGPIAALRK